MPRQLSQRLPIRIVVVMVTRTQLPIPNLIPIQNRHVTMILVRASFANSRVKAEFSWLDCRFLRVNSRSMAGCHPQRVFCMVHPNASILDEDLLPD